MPTIEYHGIEFDFADADGELLDMDIASYEEFFEHHRDEPAFEGLLEVTDRHILDYAESHLADDAWAASGARATWSLERQYGVDASDFMRSGR